jgi:hypothetical protein
MCDVDVTFTNTVDPAAGTVNPEVITSVEYETIGVISLTLKVIRSIRN